MIAQPYPSRRRLRLPQLNKANRRQRRHGLRSEFILMCERIAQEDAVRLGRLERLRREIEEQRAREREAADQFAA